ncbi:glutamate receptor 2.8 [Iris pallida]|uniref:Glutamate receptor 2.8 n=1 Tax=Iris pallida TaxID=29817 RepID=A0AAX6HI11_IRIPA|nr:glutamate receptor 2.8 [Iris pallida]
MNHSKIPFFQAVGGYHSFIYRYKQQSYLFLIRKHRTNSPFSLMRITLSFPILLLLVLLLFPSISIAAAAAPAEVNVGVILDLNSTIGSICQVSVKIALSDYYAAHPDSATRLRLYFRHSPRDDVVSAAAAAVDLIGNYRVSAILGPQTTTSVAFVADIGSKSHVPIVSFSATSPSLSPSASASFFIRAAVSDAASAQPIAALVEYFAWRRAVIVYEDSDYGSALVPYLVDALDAVGSQVTYRVAVLESASSDTILSQLYQLKSMQTRVFVVHATAGLALKIFANAKKAEMMEDGFAWIATDAITGLIGSMDRLTVLDSMQGVLGVRPHISQKSERFREFVRKWRREFLMENPNSDVVDVSTYGVWAYDAVTAVATAAEAVGVSGAKFDTAATGKASGSSSLSKLPVMESGQKLVEEIRRTELKGLAGQFKLVNGELNATVFQIANVVEEKAYGIGFWKPSNGLSMKLHSAKANNKGEEEEKEKGKGNSSSMIRLRPVFWPGGSMKVPNGFVPTTSERKLKIYVPGPVDTGFHSFLSVARNPVTKEVVAGGFVIEVFEEAVKRLPYALPFEYVMREEGKRRMKYDELMKQVPGKYDAVVGDVTITANRSEFVDFTLPYTVAGVSMVVPIRDERSKTWIFLKPLKADLWLVSGAFFVFTGFVVWVIEHRVNEEFRGPPAHQAGTVFYFTFSTLVFAHRESMVSNLSRFVVVIWIFVVFILQSSYTANLTSMLTVRKIRPTVTDINELIKRKENVGYLENSFIRGRLQKLGFDNSTLKPYKSPEQYADALKKGSTNGGVAAIIDEIPYLKVFLKDYCDSYIMAGPTNKTGGFGFAFPKGSPIVPDLSRAILNLTESDQMAEIERRWFGDETGCTIEGSKISLNQSLSFMSFWGLFLITGSTSLLALFFCLASFLYKNRHILSQVVAPKKSIKYRVHSVVKLYDQKDLTSHTFRRGELRNRAAMSMEDPSASPSVNNNIGSPVSTSDHTYGGTPSVELTSPRQERPHIGEITASND